MSTSTDLLLGRRRELGKLIKDAIANYAAEMQQIDKMLEAAGVAVPQSYGGNGADEDESTEPRNVREQVLAVLEDYPEGLPSREIAERVNNRFGREIKSSNMSWHLSHLKRDGELVLENNLWQIPSLQSQLGLADPKEEETNQAAE